MVRLVVLVLIASIGCGPTEAPGFRMVYNRSLPHVAFGAVVFTAGVLAAQSIHGCADSIGCSCLDGGGCGPTSSALLVGAVTAIISGAVLVTYGLGRTTLEPIPVAPEDPQRRADALQLGREADAAARDGDCARARTIDGQVRALDASIGMAVARLPAIHGCLVLTR